jgi:hypothetical protein
MTRVIRRIDAGARVVYLPYSLLYGLTWLQEIAFGLLKRRPVLTRYRLAASQNSVRYDSSKIAGIGWKPRLPLAEALERLVAFELSRPRVPAGEKPADAPARVSRLHASPFPHQYVPDGHD